MRRLALASLALLAVSPSAAQEPAAVPAAVERPPRVLLRTVAGDILLTLDPDAAPRHVEQILKLVRAGVYDGTHFFRVQPDFVIQLGNAQDRLQPLSPEQLALIHPIPAEISDRIHRPGALSMARSADDPDSAETSFSILLDFAPHLDGQYTVFGHVERGVEVLQELLRVPRDAQYRPLQRLTVVSAGVVRPDVPTEQVPLAAARGMMETNFWGAVRMIQAVVPGMRERGRGVVVNVSSVAGVTAAPLGGFYSASKFALEAVSEALKLEVGHFGVRVALVEPGFFDTAFRGNSRQHGVDEPPYDELHRLWDGADGKLLGGASRPRPRAVADAIADAIEGKDQRLRIPVGQDAELVCATRAKLDDAAFESAMRSTLGIDW